DADAGAVFGPGQGGQNRLVGDVPAFAPEGQGQLHRYGGVAGGVIAREGRGHVIAAVVHPGVLFFREGDVLFFGHHQFAAGLPGGHDDLGKGRLGLAGGGDADRALPHDGGCIVGQPLDAAARAVGADVGDGAGRRRGQGRGQSPVPHLHHRNLAARRLQAGAGGRQLGGGAVQQGVFQDVPGGGQVGRNGRARRVLPEAAALQRDPLRQRPGPRPVQPGAEARGGQDPGGQAGDGRLARRAGHRDVSRRPRRGQRSRKVRDGGRAGRPGGGQLLRLRR